MKPLLISFALLSMTLSPRPSSQNKEIDAAQAIISKLAITPASSFTELDLVFLKADVRYLKAHGHDPNISYPYYSYNRPAGRIEAVVNVSPKWFANVSVSEAKATFDKRGWDVCSEALFAHPQIENLDAAVYLSLCAVIFRTYDEKAKFRIIATFEKGEVTLK